MLHKLINLSPDLKRLRDEGYEIEIKHSHLLINSIPYLNSKKEINKGTLVSELTIAGNKAGKPENRLVHFIGEYPCNKDGSQIAQIKHSSRDQRLADGIITNHSFSNKPTGGFSDYYQKMTSYIDIISGPAISIDNTLTARTFKVIESKESESVFQYIDTNSSRAEIIRISDKLKNHKVGIIGLGGTGSYILDLVSKSHVQEIHLFDGDKFFQHNAFRSPSAPSIEELNNTPSKVDYFRNMYSKIHKNIISHNEYIDSSNVHLLKDLNFIFICLDKSKIKVIIFKNLEGFGISFIDVGMGIEVVNDSLIGILRVTLSTNQKREHIKQNNRVPFSDSDADGAYTQNVQIAELNALNAALAVIKWKKLYGFYQDNEGEYFSTYTINVNTITSADYES